METIRYPGISLGTEEQPVLSVSEPTLWSSQFFFFLPPSPTRRSHSVTLAILELFACISGLEGHAVGLGSFLPPHASQGLNSSPQLSGKRPITIHPEQPGVCQLS